MEKQKRGDSDMGAVADARGLKRVCVTCGIRFYDLNKRPIHCPNCKTEFTGELKLKGRRGKSAAAVEDAAQKSAKAAANDKAAHPGEETDENSDVVSLEDVKNIEDGAADDEEDLDLAADDLGDLEEIEEDLDEDEDLDVKVKEED
jgi:uncharacterized protein (TIGR02300 family)